MATGVNIANPELPLRVLARLQGLGLFQIRLRVREHQ